MYIHTHTHTHTHTQTHTYVCAYIHTYIERERETIECVIALLLLIIIILLSLFLRIMFPVVPCLIFPLFFHLKQFSKPVVTRRHVSYLILILHYFTLDYVTFYHTISNLFTY